MTQLMNRIYCHDFLSMTEREQIQFIERIQSIRVSALTAAQIKSQRITKSAIKNITKRSGTAKGKKMMKDPTQAATEALKKLSPEQIAAIIKNFPKE